eukprot:TRINITY_DN3707_c0_g1_i5.p1 TRINITY_DN3707_c0_g1~~TRINITY_DN3707_c0_g1_i5.p1  ORF type:complete len:105 (-),score=15.60 TRINITY_DN3707_c0_g1_i5:611-925(-)
MEESGLEVGSTMDVTVLKQEASQIVVSLLEFVPPGTKLKGIVTEINEFGAVLDLEGQTLPGWVHKSRVREGGVENMEESGLEVGSPIDVTVFKQEGNSIVVNSK